MSKFVLLLGAGFSRNWGGWLAAEAFEYLLGSPAIHNDQFLRSLLWKHQTSGGFEGALAEVQDAYSRNPQEGKGHLDKLQRVVSSMFDAMNAGFFDMTFDFNVDIPRTVVFFLSKFDAIFTLNQDLLLEHSYLCGNFSNGPYRNWICQELPGMRLKPGEVVDATHKWSRNQWIPGTPPFMVAAECQPLFKLHGSSNWESADGLRMLVIGGNKTRQLKHSALLGWYAEKFDEYLRIGDTRLMIIGYGFRDDHINEAISYAVMNFGLQFFNISPDGASQARAVNCTRQPGSVSAPSDLEAVFEKGIIGASRRYLSEIFGRGSPIEHANIMRFFSTGAPETP